MVAAIVLVFFLIGEGGRERRYEIDWRPPAAAGLIFLAVILWMVVQALPGVPQQLRHPIWLDLVGDLDSRWAAISINPSATWTAIVAVAPAGFLAFVAMCLAFDPRRASRLLKIIVLATTAAASYGLVAQYLGVRQMFLIDRDYYAGFLTGPFVGRNAAAMYFVIGIATATSLIAARLEEVLTLRSRRGGGLFLLTAELIRRTGVFLVADLVLVAALLDTGSRGGFIASGFALITIVLVSLRRSGADRRAAAGLFTAVLGALFTVAAIASDLLLGRLQTGVGNEDRLNVYRDTIDMIAARPWLGHGAGAFVDAFPLFHSRASSAGVWTHAHDSYLQAAAELGLPAFAALMLAIIVVIVTLLRNVGLRSESQPAATAALATLAAVAFHSIVDFSVQIQAVGLTVAVLVGAGVGETMACKARSIAQAGKVDSGDGRAFQPLEVFSVTVPSRSAPIKIAATG